MKTIRDNPQYIEALKTRDALANALGAAKVEEARLLAALAVPQAPNPLESALNLLANKPTVRTDITGLQRSLNVVRENIDTLKPGLDEQNNLLASISGELSAMACVAAATEHGEAAQGIADALERLKLAMANEVAIRQAVADAGYLCTLPELVMPMLAMNNRQDPVAAFMQRCQNVATDAADAASGAIDKPATVHILVSYPPHECGDIVVLPGREARTFVRAGRAEFSTAKPRQARRAAEPREKVWE